MLYLAHFFPVFPRFLRVFTVSTRRFQRAPSRNPGPRNSRQGNQEFRTPPFVRHRRCSGKDHLACLCVWQGLDGAGRTSEILPTIPDYAYDKHTKEGQALGRGDRHFLVRAPTIQLIPPFLSLFARFRPYLGHFSPVFPHFLRVFNVLPRRFQRAPSRRRINWMARTFRDQTVFQLTSAMFARAGACCEAHPGGAGARSDVPGQDEGGPAGGGRCAHARRPEDFPRQDRVEGWV